VRQAMQDYAANLQQTIDALDSDEQGDALLSLLEQAQNFRDAWVAHKQQAVTGEDD